jgi:hypothetical protein
MGGAVHVTVSQLLTTGILHTYLVLHDALLEAGTAHGHLPRRLAAAPDALAVGRLLGAQLLALLDALLQDLVERALRGRGRGIGGRDIGGSAAGGRVVGGHFGLCGRGVGGAEAGRGQSQSAA